MLDTRVKTIVPGSSGGAVRNNGRWSTGVKGEARQGQDKDKAGRPAVDGRQGHPHLLHNKARSADK